MLRRQGATDLGHRGKSGPEKYCLCSPEMLLTIRHRGKSGSEKYCLHSPEMLLTYGIGVKVDQKSIACIAQKLQ